MELTKRSNFKIDVTNIATTPVVIKKGLKAFDFVGVIVTSGSSVSVITSAVDNSGTVTFSIGNVSYSYNSATGQITVTTEQPVTQ